jgi:hypothetical protein
MVPPLSGISAASAGAGLGSLGKFLWPIRRGFVGLPMLVLTSEVRSSHCLSIVGSEVKKKTIDYFKCMSHWRLYPLGASSHYLIPRDYVFLS